MGYDPGDTFSRSVAHGEHKGNYMDFLATSKVLHGARFGLPVRRCWDSIPPCCRSLAQKVIATIEKAGALVCHVELPSIDERINEDGEWDWEHGGPLRSEWSVAKIDAYNDINSYLGTYLQDSAVRTIEDIVRFNVENTGTEGGVPGTVRAFADGQPCFLEMIEAKGQEDRMYHAALAHIQRQTRENGIDAALVYRKDSKVQGEEDEDPTGQEEEELDALLFFDRRGIGQQYAAQAGYPIICIPVGLDEHGMPVSLSLQHKAWNEGKLIKWASAIEDLWSQENGRRATPMFQNHLSKIIPIEPFEN